LDFIYCVTEFVTAVIVTLDYKLDVNTKRGWPARRTDWSVVLQHRGDDTAAGRAEELTVSRSVRQSLICAAVQDKQTALTQTQRCL